MRSRNLTPDRYCAAQVACDGVRLGKTQHDACERCRQTQAKRARTNATLRGEGVKLDASERRAS